MISEVITGAMSIKSVINSIEQHETELPLAIVVLEHRAQSSNPLLELDSQETSRDKGVYLVELERRRDQHSNVLSSSESEQALLKNNSESPGDCTKYNNEGVNVFVTSKEVCNIFAGMGWYSGMVESSRE